MKKNPLVYLLIVVLYIPLACLDYHHLPYSDGAEHGAAVRELARDLLNPGEPMLAEYVGKSPRYVPSIVLMATAVRLSGMDVLHAIKIFSVCFFIFFLYATVFFAREYFQDQAQAAWSIGCMLFLWGTGWHGANAYMFSALVHTAWYPSLVSFACVFMALAFACRFLREAHAVTFVCWCFFGAIAFINHPPTGTFLWIASALLVFEINGAHGLVRPWYAVAIAAAVGAIAIWPYYDFFANARAVSGGTMAETWDYTLTRTYLYSDIALRAGPALAAIPIVLMYLIKKKYPCLTLMCLCATGIYAAGFFLRINLAERFIFAGMFSAQILFAHWACGLWQSVRRGKASTVQTGCAAAAAVLLAAGAIGQAVEAFKEYIRPDFSISGHAPFICYHDPTAMHRQFADCIQPGDIVFSDVPTSWGLPLYTGAKIVSLFHTPPHVRDNDIRIQAVNRFYDPSLNNLQRLLILRHFKADKLLIHFPVAGQDIKSDITSMGLPLIMQRAAVSIFDVPADADVPVATKALPD